MSSIEHERVAKILTSVDHLAEPFRTALERESVTPSTACFVLSDAPMYETVREINPPSVLIVTESRWLYLSENMKRRTVTAVGGDLAAILYIEARVTNLRGNLSLYVVENGRINSHTFPFSSAQDQFYLKAGRTLLGGGGNIPLVGAPLSVDSAMLGSFPRAERDFVLGAVAPTEKIVAACSWPADATSAGALALTDRNLLVVGAVQVSRTTWFRREKGGGWRGVICPRTHFVRFDSTETRDGRRANLTIGMGAVTAVVTADYSRESEQSVMGVLQQAAPTIATAPRPESMAKK